MTTLCQPDTRAVVPNPFSRTATLRATKKWETVSKIWAVWWAGMIL